MSPMGWSRDWPSPARKRFPQWSGPGCRRCWPSRSLARMIPAPGPTP